MILEREAELSRLQQLVDDLESSGGRVVLVDQVDPAILKLLLR